MLPYDANLRRLKYLILFFFLLTAVGVYAHLAAGWGSNSNYALIGSLRAIAQSISYEVRLAFLLILILIVLRRFNLYNLISAQRDIPFLFLMPLAGGVICSFVVLSQTDLKALIAYSRVIHIASILGLTLVTSRVGLLGGLIIRLAHGIASAGLFYCVTLQYQQVGSRSILTIKAYSSYRWLRSPTWTFSCRFIYVALYCS